MSKNILIFGLVVLGILSFYFYQQNKTLKIDLKDCKEKTGWVPQKEISNKSGATQA